MSCLIPCSASFLTSGLSLSFLTRALSASAARCSRISTSRSISATWTSGESWTASEFDEAVLDAGLVAEEVEGLDRGQADVGVGVRVERVDQGGQGLDVGVLDRGAVAHALEPVRGRGLAEEGEGRRLPHLLDLPLERRDAPRARAAGEPAGAGADDQEEGGEGGGEGRPPEAEPLSPAGEGPPPAGRRAASLEPGLVVLEHGVEAGAEGARGLFDRQDAELGPDGRQVLDLASGTRRRRPGGPGPRAGRPRRGPRSGNRRISPGYVSQLMTPSLPGVRSRSG